VRAVITLVLALAVAVAGLASSRPATAQAPAPGPGDSALGFGLAGIVDWDSQSAFIDHMKAARPWGSGYGSDGTQLYTFLGEGDSQPLYGTPYLDDNGWVRELPIENGEPVTLETFVMVDIDDAATSFQGTYRITFDGDDGWDGETSYVEISTGAARQTVRSGDTFQLNPAGDSYYLVVRILGTNPADHVRNISIVHTDHAAQFDAGATFHPRWVELLDGAQSLRFMDWMLTNGSPISTWAERPTPDDFSYNWRGVPAEVMIDLANQLDIDPWFNMPHRATDGYVTAFADMVHDRLEPDLDVYVEYSNEAWNYIFPQTAYMGQQAIARWGANQPDVDENGNPTFGYAMEFLAARSAEMATIWRQSFGSDADHVHMTMAPLPGGTFAAQILVDAQRWRTDNNIPAGLQIYDAFASNGYYGYEFGIFPEGSGPDPEARAPELLDQINTNGEAAASAWLVDELTETGGGLDQVRDQWEDDAAFAAANGLDLVMYEGGSHFSTFVNDQTLIDFFIDFSYSQANGDLYATHLANWNEVGGSLFNAFVAIAEPGRWGSWGALRHLEDDNPRWQALQDFIDAGAVGTCAGLAVTVDLAQGQVPTAGDDVIMGTAGADIVNALDGDDVICTGSGDDTIIAGPGDDTVLAGVGNDVVSGNGGNDTIDGEAGDDTIFGGSGDDVITGGPGANRLGGGGDRDTITGGADADVISGGSGSDVDVDGGRGDDAVNGGGGNDRSVHGGDGDDTVSGNGGDDNVYGDAGADQVRGGPGDDRVFGGSGDDFLAGNDGTDLCDGGPGTDTGSCEELRNIP
jgi:hypothetical protein